MSVLCSTAGYLSVANACDTDTRPYLIHGWVRSATGAAHTLFSSGSSVAADQYHRSVGMNNSLLGQTREIANGSAGTAGSVGTMVADVWNSVAGSFLAVSGANARKSTVNAGATWANASTNVDASSGGAFTYSRIGGRANNTNCVNTVLMAGVTIWDLTGHTSDADVSALVARLGDKDDATVPDPRTVNEDVGQWWTGKLKHFWKLHDITDITDLVGGQNMVATSSGGFPKTGLDGGGNPTNPPYEVYGVPTITACDDDPLIEGQTFVLSGTNHEVAGVDPASLEWGAQAQTIGSATEGSTTATAAIGTNLYGEEYAFVLENDLGEVSDGEFVRAMIPPVGTHFVNITETPPDPALRLTANSGDLAIGWQVRYRGLLSDYGDTDIVEDISDGDVLEDGTFRFTTGLTYPLGLECSVNKNDGQGWSAWVYQTIEAPTLDIPVVIGDDEVWAVNIPANEPFTLDLSAKCPGVWTWSVSAGSLPVGLDIPDPNVGVVSGNPTPNQFTTATILITGDDGTDTLTLIMEVDEEIVPIEPIVLSTGAISQPIW